MNWHEGVWKKGKRTLTGHWVYHWSTDNFTVWLDKKDHITGRVRQFKVSGDQPNFNGWKLIKEDDDV